MYCNNCGTENTDNANFCLGCGAAFAKPMDDSRAPGNTAPANEQTTTASASQPLKKRLFCFIFGGCSVTCSSIALVYSVVTLIYCLPFAAAGGKAAVFFASFGIVFYIVTVILAASGIVFGILSERLGYKHRLNSAGLVLGIVSAAVGTLAVIAGLFLLLL